MTLEELNINPELDLSEESQDGPEGCLSLPEVVYDTKRALRVVAKGVPHRPAPRRRVLHGHAGPRRCPDARGGRLLLGGHA